MSSCYITTSSPWCHSSVHSNSFQLRGKAQYRMPNKATGSKKIPEASNIENELVRGGMTGKQTSESRGADSVTTAAVNYVENQVFFLQLEACAPCNTQRHFKTSFTWAHSAAFLTVVVVVVVVVVVPFSQGRMCGHITDLLATTAENPLVCVCVCFEPSLNTTHRAEWW